MTADTQEVDDFDFEDRNDPENPDAEAEDIPREKRVLRTQAYDKSVSDLVAMMTAEDIRLDPHYQRNYIWDNKKASLLVESILLNVPIPVIYVEEDEQSSWNVVDGLQRLNSLRRFFSNEFKLTGLEVLPELNRLQFSTLPQKAQRILKNGIFRIIVILQESHPEIKYDIFLRLNRGAVRLNEQELRNCLYRGPLNDFLKELRNVKKFQEILGINEPHPRFADAELILRAIALTKEFDWEKKTLSNYSGKMRGFLNLYMGENRSATEKELNKLGDVFIRSVDNVYTVFGTKAFRRIDPETGLAERQINRAVFDAVMVTFSKYKKEKIEQQKDKIFRAFMELPQSDSKFFEALTYGTGDKPKVEYRINIWANVLDKLLA